MLWRKVETRINDWLKEGKEALLISGARQTGKTFVIEKCLKDSKTDFVSFNLIKSPEVVDVLNDCIDRNMEDFVSRISLLAGRRMVKGRTVVFFDEIQECKEILTAVKFLVEEGSFRYILIGSLLGVELVGIKSAPVGYLRTLKMYPLDFHEFLVALNVQLELIETLRNRFEERKTVDEVVHRKLLETFYIYLVIGGMPAAVQSFVDGGDFMEVSDIHRMITEQYKVDFSKYEKEQKLRLIGAYELIPSELNSKNKRFILSDLDKNLRFERYEDSFLWFANAGVAIPVFNTTEPIVPLAINKKSNLFKLFLSDIGMLSTIYGNAAKLKLLNNGDDMNCGAMFENAVAQELASKGYNLFYYNSKRLGEIDFIIDSNGACLPIEVKSGKDYSVHSALDNVLENSDFNIPFAYVLSKGNVRVDGKIVYLPVYMSMFIEEHNLPTRVSIPDLSKLVL